MTLPPVEEFRILQLPIQNRTHFGEWLNVSWDASCAVNVLATSPYAAIDSERRVDSRILYADALREVRLRGTGAALIVSPTDIYLDCVDLLEKDFLPIICPIGLDKNFDTYNINADDAACAIAKAVHAEKLAFLTDIEGVYLDPNDPSTLLSKLFVKEAKELIDNGNVGGGMIPKLQNCIDAIEEGVSRVHILDGRIPHCLLLEIFTNKGIGTAILRKDEIKDYDV